MLRNFFITFGITCSFGTTFLKLKNKIIPWICWYAVKFNCWMITQFTLAGWEAETLFLWMIIFLFFIPFLIFLQSTVTAKHVVVQGLPEIRNVFSKMFNFRLAIKQLSETVCKEGLIFLESHERGERRREQCKSVFHVFKLWFMKIKNYHFL